MYDSTHDTLAHVRRVQTLLHEVCAELMRRAVVHDASKLQSPEKECFDEITPLLKGVTYGSEEYRATLRQMKPAIEHHTNNNSHHPEYYRWFCPVCKSHWNQQQYEEAPQGPNDTGARFCPQCSGPGVVYETELMDKPNAGINGFTLFDLVEMWCDWKAASERHADGSIAKSIQINRERFGMSEQLAGILENTRVEMNW